MKKFSKIIALLLIITFVSFNFSGCLSYLSKDDPHWGYALIDFVILPISVLSLIIYLLVTEADEAGYEYLVNMDTDSLTKNTFMLIEKVQSLPDTEIASLRQIVDIISKTECYSMLDRFTSLTETQQASLLSAYNSLPETEISASINRISSSSEAETISLLKKFNSFSDEEIASITEILNSMALQHIAAAY